MRAARISFRNQRSAPPSLGRRFFHAVLLLLVVWLGGFLAFLAAIPSKVPEPDRPVDAIVVLTGGDVRLAEGFALLDRGLARKLLVSGVSSGVDLPALLRTLDGAAQPNEALLDCCVTLGYDARSTEGNARESLRWLTGNNFTAVRLVTASYHMNRSLLEFHRVMPDITIMPHPVFPRQMQDPYWFTRPNTMLLLINEYHKYVAAAARAWAGEIGNTAASLATRLTATVGL
jgi:uncharacterized SAM-binding protein YcdF (DUF218 family)